MRSFEEEDAPSDVEVADETPQEFAKWRTSDPSQKSGAEVGVSESSVARTQDDALALPHR